MAYEKMKKRVYLDYNATTPIDPRVLETSQHLLKVDFGNPSSLHREGQRARSAVNQARAELARLIDCEENELVFTSGATEAINAVILGTYYQSDAIRGHVVTTQVEHPAVLECCRFLESRGWQMTYLAVDSHGTMDPGDLKKAIRPDTRLVSVMHANNEIGTIEPVEEVGAIALEAGVPFLTDAVQSLGRLPVKLASWNASFAVFSAHKMGAFKGTGLLYIRRDQNLPPFILGGEQERGQRAGTENVAGIVAMTEAVRLSLECQTEEMVRVQKLKCRLQEGLQSNLDSIRVSGHPEHCLANTLHVAFQDLEAEELLMNFDLAGIAVSNGSACNSGSVQPSHVVEAIGLAERFKRGTVRFSLGRETTAEEIESVIQKTIDIVRRLRPGGASC
jgi:cysteine desulfurase